MLPSSLRHCRTLFSDFPVVAAPDVRYAGRWTLFDHPKLYEMKQTSLFLLLLFSIAYPLKLQAKTLGIIKNEGFSCIIEEDTGKRVSFTADADIDADGANGQNGAKAAYMADDSGSEYLANGGMKRVNGKVVCAHSWARSIVMLDSDNQPKMFPGGIIASTTWYIHKKRDKSDPAAYVDAETVPYIVVPPVIVQSTKGTVCGCRARVTWKGKSVDCVVADKGPAGKIGELSIAAARALGMPSSPRSGGCTKPEVFYELWPGIAAEGFELQKH